MKQTYRLEQKISRHTFESPFYNEDRFLRDAAHRMVRDMPLDKVESLFNLKLIDPKKDIEGCLDRNEFDYLQTMIYDNVLKIEGEVTI